MSPIQNCDYGEWNLLFYFIYKLYCISVFILLKWILNYSLIFLYGNYRCKLPHYNVILYILGVLNYSFVGCSGTFAVLCQE